MCFFYNWSCGFFSSYPGLVEKHVYQSSEDGRSKYSESTHSTEVFALTFWFNIYLYNCIAKTKSFNVFCFDCTTWVSYHNWNYYLWYCQITASQKTLVKNEKTILCEIVDTSIEALESTKNFRTKISQQKFPNKNFSTKISEQKFSNKHFRTKIVTFLYY